MRFALLIVLAGAAGCANQIGDPGSGLPFDCSVPMDATLTISTPADPSMELRIQSCRLDVDACPDLCALAMSRNGISSAPETCSVTFESSEVTAKVTYVLAQCMPVEDGSGTGSGSVP